MAEVIRWQKRKMKKINIMENKNAYDVEKIEEIGKILHIVIYAGRYSYL